MKKIINNAADVEEEMIEGFVLANSRRVRRLDDSNIILRRKFKFDKVSLLIGGGSGHEPAHLGYVGFGMLDCAVCGSIFTSPTPADFLKAIKAVSNDKGVLCIIKNYSGDVINSEMAIDEARSQGIKVDSVVVDDDVATADSEIGRRGIAGTLLVYKIAGAAAEAGLDLSIVKRLALKAIDNVCSMGMATSPCTIPASGVASFELGKQEIELGTGIHGEPGISRERFTTANDIANKMLNQILNNFDCANREVVVMINGMGATPLMELLIVNKFVHEHLINNSIKIYDTMIGNYMTSMEMSGFSITLLRLDDELKSYYDAAADTFALKK